MWIGLLWWFNVVLLPGEPKLPAHLQAALGKSLSPPTFFWRRWAAMGAMGFGLILACLDGYILQALTLDSNEGFASPRYIVIGIGMWLGLIMWFNAWFVIQPSLRGSPSPTTTARRFSRINALLSIPMLFSMVAAANIL
jgi:uncharacterized membrane protein